MDLILCHQTADFDALGSAVGAAKLYPGAQIVLTGGSHESLHEFIAVHRHAYPLLDLRAVHPDRIRRLILVDCHDPSRLGTAAQWLSLPGVKIHIYDHHPTGGQDLRILGEVELCCIEPVGSTCTLMVERLQDRPELKLDPFEVTALALGIHVDTGSLTFPSTTVRDAQALTWLMEQGVNLLLLGRYLDQGLSPALQDLLSQGLQQLQIERVGDFQLASWVLDLPEFVAGLAGVVMHLMELTDVDVLILAARQGSRLSLIARAKPEFAQLHTLMQAYGGGGHARAAAASLKHWPQDPTEIVAEMIQRIRSQVPPSICAAQLMSSPVRTIRADVSITEAQRVLLRYGHSGLVVTDESARLLGVISRRDIDIALHHGFGHAPVKGYMTTAVKTILPDTSLLEIQTLMVKWDIGRLPVLHEGELLGIVTRTDVLRHLHGLPAPARLEILGSAIPSPSLSLLSDPQRQILQQAAEIADELGVRLYLVGGAVRDLLLGRPTFDLDLVVDGVYPVASDSAWEGWGLKVGKALHQLHPHTRLEIHGSYQTAALSWPNGVLIDIATARTEFYAYPAAPPEVSVGSIQQDLYRRDFTINALAVRLNGSEAGQVLDFFNGLEDLKQGRIRVLHPNSFIEDPTRIYRAVRFAVRLGFTVEAQTQATIRGAIASGLLDAVGGDRLKQELAYSLKAPRWRQAFDLLAEWQALRCIHPDLVWSVELWQSMRRLSFWVHHFHSRYPECASHDTWQLRLEVMLIWLPQADQVARQLHLTDAGINRLTNLSTRIQQLLPNLVADLRPSQFSTLLQSWTVAELMLLAAITDPIHRRILYRYLSQWRPLKPPLNGHDLKQMGYVQGRQFQEILAHLRQVTLDGEVTDPATARAFVRQHYPAL